VCVRIHHRTIGQSYVREREIEGDREREYISIYIYIRIYTLIYKHESNITTVMRLALFYSS